MLNLSLKNRQTLILASNGILFSLSASFGLFRYSQLGMGGFPYAAAAVCALIFLNSIYLIYSSDLVRAEAATILIVLAGYLASTANSGGFAGAPSTLAPIIPMIAILWFGARAGWRFLGILIALLTVVLYVDLKDFIPESPLAKDEVVVSHYLSAVLTSVICTWIAWAFAQSKEVDISHNQHQASIDHLTGLSNRRALDLAVLREVGRARRDRNWLSLIFVDIDYFKRFNDTNGHQAGDKCLVTVARIIAEIAQRPADVVARFGGEEFAVLLPDTGSDGARVVAENIRQAVQNARMPYGDGRGDYLSLTLGVVTAKGSNIKSVTDLVAEADAALYRGKSNGRNQVVLKSIFSTNVDNIGYA